MKVDRPLLLCYIKNKHRNDKEARYGGDKFIGKGEGKI